MGNNTLNYTQRPAADPVSVWDQGEPNPVVQRGPWRGPAVAAASLACITSPPVLGIVVGLGHMLLAERPHVSVAALVYFLVLPASTALAFVATAIAYPLNTSPAAARERSMCRRALALNLIPLAANIALFMLGLFAMAAGFHSND